MKFKDSLRKLNKMKIGFLANKGKSNDIIFLKFKNNFQKSCKTKEFFFPQIKSNQGIISFCQEEYKHLTCKTIRSLFLWRKTCKSEIKNAK